jgi:hypothetical protein
MKISHNATEIGQLTPRELSTDFFSVFQDAFSDIIRYEKRSCMSKEKQKGLDENLSP